MLNFKKLLYTAVLAWVSSAAAGPTEDYFHAVEVDAANVVASLLKSGLDPNVRDPQGQTGLVLALRGDANGVVRILLDQDKVDFDLANASGETPLMMAALKGNLGVVHALLARGAKVNREGWSALHYAASGPEPDVVALLLDRGAWIDAPSPNGTTPLMMAARYGSIDSANLLLRRGADVRTQNQRGLDAAEFARGGGRDELARLLTPK